MSPWIGSGHSLVRCLIKRGDVDIGHAKSPFATRLSPVRCRFTARKTEGPKPSAFAFVSAFPDGHICEVRSIFSLLVASDEQLLRSLPDRSCLRRSSRSGSGTACG